MKANYYLGRGLSMMIGAGLVLGSAHLVVEARHLDGADAAITYMLAATMIAGGIALQFMRGTHKALLTVAIVAGEIYAGVAVYQVDMIARHNERLAFAQKQALEVRKVSEGKAQAELDKAAHEAATARLAKAETAKAQADAVVAANNKTRDCKRECMAGNIGQADKAKLEVDAARDNLAKNPKPLIVTDIDTTLPALPEIDARVETAMPVLKSVAVNVAGIVLLAFGCHGSRRKEEKAKADVPKIEACPEPLDLYPGATRSMPSLKDRPAKSALVADNDTTEQSDFPGVSEFELAKIAALFRSEIEPPQGPKGGSKIIRPKRWHRDEVRADLAQVLAEGGSFPSQRAMAAKYGVPTTTLHDWFKAWAAEGQEVPRHQVGRRKMVG